MIFLSLIYHIFIKFCSGTTKIQPLFVPGLLFFTLIRWSKTVFFMFFSNFFCFLVVKTCHGKMIYRDTKNRYFDGFVLTVPACPSSLFYMLTLRYYLKFFVFFPLKTSGLAKMKIAYNFFFFCKIPYIFSIILLYKPLCKKC